MVEKIATFQNVKAGVDGVQFGAVRRCVWKWVSGHKVPVSVGSNRAMLNYNIVGGDFYCPASETARAVLSHSRALQSDRTMTGPPSRY